MLQVRLGCRVVSTLTDRQTNLFITLSTLLQYLHLHIYCTWNTVVFPKSPCAAEIAFLRWKSISFFSRLNSACCTPFLTSPVPIPLLQLSPSLSCTSIASLNNTVETIQIYFYCTWYNTKCSKECCMGNSTVPYMPQANKNNSGIMVRWKKKL